MTVSVGHCHPRLVEAAKKQLERLWHTTCIYYNDVNAQYAQELAAKLPKGLDCVFLANSGTDANELAVQMARLYTQNYD